jgi:hypothetical protein
MPKLEQNQKFTEEVNKILESIEGKPKDMCPYEQDAEGSNGYHFIRTGYLGRHCISITKGSFYWVIAVDYDGNLISEGNLVNITGYYHIETNPNCQLNDLREALKNTVQFFPEINPARYDLRDREENYAFLCNLFKRLLKSDINLSRLDASSNNKIAYHVTLKDTNLLTNSNDSGETIAELLIARLKIVHPSITIEKIITEDGRVGFEIVREEIPTILTAGDELKNEPKTAQKFGTTSWSLKWLAAKALWKNPNINPTAIMPYLVEVSSTARKFTI